MPVATYIILFIAFLAVEALYIKVVGHCGSLLKAPNHRSSHTLPTVTGGGIVIYIAAVVAAVMFMPFDLALSFICPLTLLAAVSFADDIRDLPVASRMVAQIASVNLAILLYTSEWQGLCHLSGLLFLILVALPLVYIINVYNFMDGISGMHAAYTLVVLGSLYLWGDWADEWFRPALIVIALGVAAFAFFNFRVPAKCFSGDVGSISAGFIVLFMFVCGDMHAELQSILIFTLPMMLSVYLVDGTLTIIRRLINGRNIFASHREHLYQLLANECGIPHLVIASTYALLQLAINVAGYVWFHNSMLGAYTFFVYLALSIIHITAVNIIHRRTAKRNIDNND